MIHHCTLYHHRHIHLGIRYDILQHPLSLYLYLGNSIPLDMSQTKYHYSTRLAYTSQHLSPILHIMSCLLYIHPLGLMISHCLRSQHYHTNLQSGNPHARSGLPLAIRLLPFQQYIVKPGYSYYLSCPHLFPMLNRIRPHHKQDYMHHYSANYRNSTYIPLHKYKPLTVLSNYILHHYPQHMLYMPSTQGTM